MFGSKDLIGIEIGGQYLKIIHLNNKQEILNWVSTDIRTLNDDGIVDFIRNYLQEKSIKTLDVINPVPARYTITKNIELPSTNPAEIKQIIKLQAGHHSPYSPEEIVIDYIPIGVFRGGYTRIFLIIVNRDTIKRNFDIIERSGLRLKKMVLSLETMVIWYKDRSPSNSLGILHLDADNTDFLVIKEQKPIFLRNIPVGVEQLLYDRDKYAPQLLEEINHSLEAYQTEQLESLSKIIACGATLNATELLRQIPEKTNLTVDIEGNLEGLKLAPTAPDIKGTASDLSVIGLTSGVIKYNKTHLDLTPEEVKLRESVAEKSRDIIWLGTLIFFILILFLSIFAQKIWMKNRIVKVLENESQKYQKEAAGLKDTRRKIGQAKNHFRRRDFALNALTEIHKCMTPELYLTNLVIDDPQSSGRDQQNITRFVLRGTANTTADVHQMADKLGKSKCFKDVKPPATMPRTETNRANGNKREVVDFEIGGKLGLE
ncbi:MAG TPA: pilus assembly protein PilM [Planctomycetota bacterium]|nr:pilus assembly protein PilM [Planctomycetota bacterium]